MRRVNLDNSEGRVPERFIEESLPEVSHCTPIQLVQKPLEECRTLWRTTRGITLHTNPVGAEAFGGHIGTA